MGLTDQQAFLPQGHHFFSNPIQLTNTADQTAVHLSVKSRTLCSLSLDCYNLSFPMVVTDTYSTLSRVTLLAPATGGQAAMLLLSASTSPRLRQAKHI